MSKSFIMSKLYEISENSYFRWKKKDHKLLTTLIETYFEKEDIEEFLKTGKVTKLETLKSFNLQQSNLLINLLYKTHSSSNLFFFITDILSNILTDKKDHNNNIKEYYINLIDNHSFDTTTIVNLIDNKLISDQLYFFLNINKHSDFLEIKQSFIDTNYEWVYYYLKLIRLVSEKNLVFLIDLNTEMSEERRIPNIPDRSCSNSKLNSQYYTKIIQSYIEIINNDNWYDLPTINKFENFFDYKNNEFSSFLSKDFLNM